MDKKTKDSAANAVKGTLKLLRFVGDTAVGTGILCGKIIHYNAVKAYYKHVKKEPLPPEVADQIFH